MNVTVHSIPPGRAVATGTLGAIALSRFLRELLCEISPMDPMTLVTVSAFLAVVALVASYLPARRATRVDPVDALRTE